MAEVDYVLKDIKVIEKNKDIDLKNLYRFLKKILSDHGYFVIEKEYVNQLKNDIRNKTIKLKGSKRVDDYSMYNIGYGIRLTNAEEIEGKDGFLFHGDISLSFNSYIVKDYSSKWESSPILKFLRTIYDKLFLNIIFTKQEKELRDETFDIVNKTKKYLGG